MNLIMPHKNFNINYLHILLLVYVNQIQGKIVTRQKNRLCGGRKRDLVESDIGPPVGHSIKKLPFFSAAMISGWGCFFGIGPVGFFRV